ncbi:MAG: class I SAM-dependent methyltransferase [Erysipelotrichales bacterium]
MKEANSYHNFAYYYNQLIPQSFYEDLASKIKSYGSFNNVLDIACGSGSLCFLLKDKYNSVSGLDYSDEMLMIAQQENFQLKKGVSFFNQDMNDLLLNKDSYDLITCSLDSLNYVKTNKIDDIFSKIEIALQKNGYFIFDVLTQYYIDDIVYDYYQSEEINDFEYYWYVKKVDDSTIEHDLSIITSNDKYHEIHYQYIHHEIYIEELIRKYNFELIKKEEEYNELDETKASRIYYTIRKGR